MSDIDQRSIGAMEASIAGMIRAIDGTTKAIDEVRIEFRRWMEDIEARIEAHAVVDTLAHADHGKRLSVVENKFTTGRILARALPLAVAVGMLIGMLLRPGGLGESLWLRLIGP